MSDEIRIVLIGKTGVGKSSTGNTLLNAVKFEAVCSASSATRTIRREVGNYGSKETIIVDTPGLCDTDLPEKEVMMEIPKCVAAVSKGIHAFAFVVSIAARFTEEEQKAVKNFAECFGENIYTHAVVVFTRFNDLRKNKQTIEGYISSAPKQLKEFLELCGNRYVALENDALLQGDTETQEKQVDEFFTKVQDMIKTNGGNVYTNAMLKQSEVFMQQRIAKAEKKIFEDKKRQEEELEKKWELRMKDVKSEQKEEFDKEFEKFKESVEKKYQKQLKEVVKLEQDKIINEEPGAWESWLTGFAIVADSYIKYLHNKDLINTFSAILHNINKTLNFIIKDK